MSGINDGGQAFPCAGLSGLPNDNFIHPEGGMTLRDYFAAKALVGELCSQSDETGYYSDDKKLALRCYGIADAMIAARATPSGEGRE